MIRPFSCHACGHVPTKGPILPIWYCPICKAPTIFGNKSITSLKRKKAAKKAADIPDLSRSKSEGPVAWIPISFYPGKPQFPGNATANQDSQDDPKSSKRDNEC